MYRTRSMILLACLLLSALYPRCCQGQTAAHAEDKLYATPSIVISRYHAGNSLVSGEWKELPTSAPEIFNGGTSRAGQEVFLKAEALPAAATGTSYRWTIGTGTAGEAVKGFQFSHDVKLDYFDSPTAQHVLSPREGGPVNLPSSIVAQRVYFFWVAGIPRGFPESVACHSDGANGKPGLSAFAQMTVYKPKVCPGGVHHESNKIQIDPDLGVVRYGTTNPAASWMDQGEGAEVNLEGFDGSDRYFWTQLLTTGWGCGTQSKEKSKGLWNVHQPTLDTFWQSREEESDTDVAQYVQHEDLGDSPSFHKLVGQVGAGVYEQFRAWYMYEPMPGYDGPLTIPVPIMSFGWSWMADEKKDQDGHWKLTDHNTWPDFGDIDSTLEYPTWKQVIRSDALTIEDLIVPF